MNRREFTKTVGFVAAGLGSPVLAGCMNGRTDVGGNDDGDDGGGDVEVTDTEFEVTNVESGTEVSEAEISFDDEASEVVVTGTITGSDGCKTAVLESAGYDGEADELGVRVVTQDREDAGEACTQALVEISYTATVTFSGGLPHNAAVYHDGSRVTGASWESASNSAGVHQD